MVLSLLKEIAILFTYVTVQYNIVMYELKSDKEWYSVTDIRKSQKIQKKIGDAIQTCQFNTVKNSK